MTQIPIYLQYNNYNDNDIRTSGDGDKNAEKENRIDPTRRASGGHTCGILTCLAQRSRRRTYTYLSPIITCGALPQEGLKRKRSSSPISVFTRNLIVISKKPYTLVLPVNQTRSLNQAWGRNITI